mmetsp:Transcript_20889/g.46412  ORF Transcript_20889/g.46412 Transcript_20889/m.46412 type:complete len:205 (-) Transcript_20889:198-812(-)
MAPTSGLPRLRFAVAALRAGAPPPRDGTTSSSRSPIPACVPAPALASSTFPSSPPGPTAEYLPDGRSSSPAIFAAESDANETKADSAARPTTATSRVSATCLLCTREAQNDTTPSPPSPMAADVRAGTALDESVGRPSSYGERGEARPGDGGAGRSGGGHDRGAASSSSQSKGSSAGPVPGGDVRWTVMSIVTLGGPGRRARGA